MKPVHVIFLLLLFSFVGCSPQTDQQVAEQPETANPNAITRAELEKEPEPKQESEKAKEPKEPVVDHSKSPPSETEPASKNDQKAAPPEPATPAPATPEPKQVPALEQEPKLKQESETKPEPKPASWLERARFWDIANRVIADRNQEPIKLDEKSMKEMVLLNDQVTQYIERLNWLHDMLELRQSLIESKFIDRQLTASLRGEITLPEGTRERRNKLRSASLPSVDGLRRILPGMDRAIIEDRLRKGDLFRLAIGLRGSLADFVALRKLEVAQDEFLLSFPTMRLRALEEFSQIRQYGRRSLNETMATARELWADVPAKRKKRFDFHSERLSPDQISTSFDPKASGRTAFRVMSREEFASIRELIKEIEKQSGGPEPLLVFPDVAEIPSRKRLIEASKRNIDAVNEADIQAIRDFRQHLVDRFDDDDKKSYQEKDERTEKELQEEFDYLLGRHNLSEYGVVSMIDLAFKLEPNWKKVMKVARSSYPKKYNSFLNKRKEAVFFAGADYYFGEESK